MHNNTTGENPAIDYMCLRGSDEKWCTHNKNRNKLFITGTSQIICFAVINGTEWVSG